MLFKQEYGPHTILLLRWILIIINGIILFYGYPEKEGVYFPAYLIISYILTNVLLLFCPEGWLRKKRFLSIIVLVDVCVTSLILFLAAPGDSQFYMIFFLILLVAAGTRQTKLIYFAFGLIIVVYGISLGLKSPEAIWETKTLLRFPFIFIVTFFFHGMIESYNRLFQEKENLKEESLELAALAEIAQSIGQDRNLPKFLLTVTQILTGLLTLQRCTAIYMDSKEEIGYMVSSDDAVEKGCLILNIRKYPGILKSLKKENFLEKPRVLSPLRVEPPKYILKIIPLTFNDKNLGTLYLRANTPRKKLTQREEFFLNRLSHITSVAVFNFRLDRKAVLKELNELAGEE